MADTTRVEEIISQAALKGVDELTLKVNASVASLEELLANAVKINSAFATIKTPKEFNAGIKEITVSEKKLIKASEDLAIAQQKLNNASALQAQKEAINALTIKNKELTVALKEQELLKKRSIEADRVAARSQTEAAAAEKQRIQEQLAAGRELILQKREELAAQEKITAELAQPIPSGFTNQRAQLVKEPTQTASFVPTTELETQIQLLQKSQTALAANKAQQESLRKSLRDGTITQAEYDRELNKAIQLELEHKQVIAGANREISLLQKNDLAVKGSLEQRRLALARLNKEYDNLAPQERNAAFGVRQQGIITRLTAQVQELEMATGRAQRNVGNYGNAFTGALSKGFGLLRNIAYLLPGVGIAGLLGFIVDPIVAFVGKLFEADNAITKTKEVLEGAKSTFSSAAANVNELKINIQLAKEGFLDKNKVVNQYNDTIGKTTGVVKTLDEAERALTKNADAYVRFTLLKAAANEALGKAAELALNAQVEIRKDNKEEAGFLSNITSLFGQDFDSEAGRKEYQRKLEVAGAKNKVATVNQLNKNKKQFEDIAKDFQKQAAEIAKKFNFDFFVGKEDDKTAKDSTQIKAITKKFFDEQLKDQAAALKLISKDQAFYYLDRVAKRKEAFEVEKQLNKKELQTALDNEAAKLKAVQDGEAAKGKNGSKNAVINAQREFNSAVDEINIKAAYSAKKLEATKDEDILQIRNQFNLDSLAADKKRNEDALVLIAAQVKAEEDRIKSGLDHRLNLIQASGDVELKILEDEKNAKLALAKGEGERVKIEETYRQKGLKSELNTNKLKLQASVEAQKELLALARKDNSDPKIVDALVKQLLELQRQIAEIDGRKIKLGFEIDASKIDQFIAAFDKIRDKALQVFDVIGGVINSSVISQKNAIQDQSDQIEKSSQAEIDAINASADTEEKKAARVQLVNARTQAQKEILAQRQRQLDQRNAEFEKARTIAEIILNTAAAIAKQIKATPLPAGLGFVAAVAALGAAQLAVAIATPVPRFEHGTMDAPGGLAYVNEKRKELIVTPSGQLIETPGTPAVMNIPEHSQVYPDMKAIMERGISKRELVNINQKGDKAMFYFLGGKLDRLDKTIKNKTETHFHQRGDGWERIKKSGGNQTRYIN